MEKILQNGVTASSFMRYVTPSVIMLVFYALYSIIDGVFVANYVGSDALAAINIVYPLVGFVWGVSVMLASGSSAIVAIRMGEGKQQEANEKFTVISIVAVIIGIVMIFFAVFFLDDVLVYMGATPRLIDYCLTYGQIIAYSSPFAIVGVIFEYFIRIDGRPGFTLFLYIIGGVINIIFDYVFIAVMKLGIAGAALATGLGLIISAVVGLWYFIARPITLKFAWPRFEGRYILSSMINGSSEMVTECSVGITTLLFNLAALKFAGEDGVAALTIVLYVQYLLVSVHLGYVTGTAPLISYYYGAKNYAVVDRCLVYSKRFLIISSIVVFLFSECSASLLAQIFTEKGTEVYDMALHGLRIIGISFLFTGVNVFASGMFTAYANGQISALVSFSRALVMVIIGLLFLPHLFALNGVWMTLPFAEIATVIPAIALIWIYRKKYHYTWKKPPQTILQRENLTSKSQQTCLSNEEL